MTLDDVKTAMEEAVRPLLGRSEKDAFVEVVLAIRRVSERLRASEGCPDYSVRPYIREGVILGFELESRVSMGTVDKPLS